MASLSDELEVLSASIQQVTSPQLQRVLYHFVASLRRQKVAEHSLSVGEPAPNFILNDQQGRPVRLQEQLTYGPVVLAFFRGGWCPYCNLTLRNYHHALPDINMRGGRLLAITPENPTHVHRTVQKNQTDFPLLHDVGSEVARQFGISVLLSTYMASFYRSLGLNVAKRNADVVARLPIPATYLIDQQGIIRYAFVEEDYTRRAKIPKILTMLSQLSDELVPSYG